MPPTINGLELKVVFQGPVDTPLVAKWADTGQNGLATVRLPAGTTELQKRLSVDNPNKAELVVTGIDIQTASPLVKSISIVGDTVTLPAESVDSNVAFRLLFEDSAPLDTVAGVVTVKVAEV